MSRHRVAVFESKTDGRSNRTDLQFARTPVADMGQSHILMWWMLQEVQNRFFSETGKVMGLGLWNKIQLTEDMWKRYADVARSSSVGSTKSVVLAGSCRLINASDRGRTCPEPQSLRSTSVSHCAYCQPQ
jgi:hypothetical protein